MIKHIRDFDVKGRKTLVRCDFNVPMDENGKILDSLRVERTLPTLKFLIEKGAKIILMSHLSPEDKKSGGAKLPSLKSVADLLKELLGKDIAFCGQCVGEEAKSASDKLQDGEILLLENLRRNEGEEKNDENFANELAFLGEIYVNDAFGVSHRAHASVSAITSFLPSYAGFLLSEEVETISKILENPQRPMVSIIGGVKLATKVKVIENLLKISDHALVGGGVANTIVQAKGMMMSGLSIDDEVKKLADKIDLTNPKLHLPIDGIACLDPDNQEYARVTSIGMVRKEEKMYDIGPETIKLFSEIIKQAKTIFFNGPMGLMEKKRFENGTLEVAKAITQSNAFSITGGGETNAFLKQHDLISKFSYVSTGGGAMLAFIDGQKLPGLEALGYYAKGI